MSESITLTDNISLIADGGRIAIMRNGERIRSIAPHLGKPIYIRVDGAKPENEEEAEARAGKTRRKLEK